MDDGAETYEARETADGTFKVIHRPSGRVVLIYGAALMELDKAWAEDFATKLNASARALSDAGSSPTRH